MTASNLSLTNIRYQRRKYTTLRKHRPAPASMPAPSNKNKQASSSLYCATMLHTLRIRHGPPIHRTSSDRSTPVSKIPFVRVQVFLVCTYVLRRVHSALLENIEPVNENGRKLLILLFQSLMSYTAKSQGSG